MKKTGEWPVLLGIRTKTLARMLIRVYARRKGEQQKAIDGEDTFMWGERGPRVHGEHLPCYAGAWCGMGS